jgi:hypothetical protein
MIRRVAVRPDPETGLVSREAHVQAFMDLEAMCWTAGGVGSVIVDRTRTNVPGEMVTTFAVVEWKDRTDAKPAPESESHDLADSAQPAPNDDTLNPLEQIAQAAGLSVDEVIQRISSPSVANGAEPEPPADEPEEDLSSIPEHLRG